jgi:hypothetical protein
LETASKIVCPPSGSIGCDPEVVIATAADYALQNRSKAQNYIYGALSQSGELEFAIENLPKDRTGCRGWWMFVKMMDHFGSSVAEIKGLWTYGDNLDAMNRLTSGGAMTIAQAAFQGPTGRYALAHGFVNVRVIEEIGLPGAYSRIVVLFSR